MRVSVVLLLFFFCCVQLQRGDDQLVVGDVQLLNKSHVESSEPDQTSVHPDVWTELRELRNMVAELKKQNTALEGRVVSTEVGVEALREENASSMCRVVLLRTIQDSQYIKGRGQKTQRK
ncbi:uncharacterized protein LOC118802198 isoform X3 [Colossoma macropomum]|uniref:uncharacterized protein LOC118802198 isoform X3 n=1 Tax=Colossoma macropomum TaxID=42526 RepID=UPI001863A322|nr:uncharacterized protein LOC118802198 isoform X3 [Colossoma macropomum]